MSLKQIGDSNFNMLTIGSNLPTALATNISLSALKTRYTGSTTAYANVSASKMSLWYLATCQAGIASNISQYPISNPSAPLNPTNTKSSPAYTGWVYAGTSSPWRPAALSEFKKSANTRPSVTIVKGALPGTKKSGISNYFSLSLTAKWIDNTDATVTPLGPGTAFFFWIQGPDPTFVIGQWYLAVAGVPYIFAKLLKGTYKIYVQDAWGAGNQFDASYTTTYPPAG